MTKVPIRHLVSGACFFVAVLLLVVIGFDDRGRHFVVKEAVGKADRSGTYDLSKARMLNKVFGHVRTNYVDMTRVAPREMVVAGLRAVQDSVPEVMVEVSADKRGRPTSVTVKVDTKSKDFALGKVTDLYTLTWKLMDVFDFLERHLPPSVNLEELEYAAVNGMLETLDPHSILLTPRIYRDMQVGTQGKFGGLGIVISQKDGYITVMSVMDETPAKRSGLKSGDMIVQIGEESTVNMPLNDAVNRLRGEPGTSITIWIKREGWTAPKGFTVTREEIRVRSVQHHELGGNVGYVKIRTFQGNTFEDLQDSLQKLSRRPGGLKGLVLDLRDNPGGLLEQAISISDRFIANGTVVTTVRGGSKGQEREARHATNRGTMSDIPIVVLIDRGSASASEIVAGALKNNNRALIVGGTSFGKGSVQVIYKLGEAALKLTVAQYLTPGDISIQGTGIVPDIEIIELRANNVDSLDLYSDAAEIYGEAKLKKSLSSRRTRTDRPSIRLEMLESKPAKKGDAWVPDALTSLARDLLKSAPATNRKQALVQAHGFIKTRQVAEEGVLAKKLQTLGIDWTAGPPANKRAKVKLDLTITKPDGSPVTSVGAGEALKITATATNTGAKPLHRVLGVVKSAIGALDDTELVFGKLAPGQSQTFSTKVTLGRSTWTTGDLLEVKLLADKVSLGSVKPASVQVAAKPRSRFAYRARIDDSAKGNGDGLIQRGEKFRLVLDITNVGEGPSAKTLATIKNESGEDVFIETGRQRLGNLGVGETVSASFDLKVKSSLKPRNVSFRVTIYDQRLRSWSNHELNLKVFPAELPAAAKATGFVEVGASGALVRAGAHTDVPAVAKAAAGSTMTVHAKAGDWYKVAWTAPSGDAAPALGWVAKQRVKEVAGESVSAVLDKVTPRVHHAPPKLSLARLSKGATPPKLVVDSATFSLVGNAHFGEGSGAGRRYVYVFRGGDKVFFKSMPSAGNDDVLDFVAKVPLEKGSNTLTVVAREGDGDATRHKVIVFRK